jgi:hypothetical protein
VKVLFATDAWGPPDPAGAAAHARPVRELAHGLASMGDTVTVFARASSAADQDPRVRLRRLERADPWPEHWQKTASTTAARAFRAALAEERPDVLHVHHWRGLTRELVLLAARAGVPAVVSLHDAWTSCPIGTRVLPDSGRACDAVVGVHPCVACASSVPPRTPWVPREARYMALAERQRDVEQELRLARVVLAPDAARAEERKRFLGPACAALAIEAVAADDAAAHRAVYARAVAAGAPAVPAAKDDWYGERMRAFVEEQWDAALAATPPGELGLAPPAAG